MGNAIGERLAPKSAAAQVGGGSGPASELEEVQITARYVGPGMEAANARLDNNPVNSVYQPGASRTPDEVRAAEAVAASPIGVIETVVSTAPQWRPGEMVIYQDLMTAALIRGQDFNEDYASAQAQDAYRENMRRQADNFLIDTFTPYGQGKNAAVGLINLGIKAYGGLRGLEALRYGADMQTAAAVVEGFNSLQIDADAPFAAMMGRSLAPMVNDVRAWSENTFGIGGSTVLGAAGEFALDALALVGAGGAARRFVPELDITLGSRAPLPQIGGNVAMAETGAVDRLLYGARVGEGLPNTAGVAIPARPTPAQFESLTMKHDVEFAVTYKLGPNEGGGGGQYFLHSGSRGSVGVPLEADRMVIYHTHPGGTAYASQADMDMLKLFQQVGSPQRSSQIVPVGNDVVRFGTDYAKR